MVRLNIRVRRWFIIIWCLSLWAFLAVFPPAYESYYPDQASREAFLQGMQNNPGMIAMWGPLESPATVGQIVVWEAGSFVLLLGSVMAILLNVGLHRKAEHRGLTELQLSTGIRRSSPAAAALLTTCLVALLIGVGSTLILWLSGFYVADMPTRGAVTFGATVTLTLIGSALLAQLILLFVSREPSLNRVALLTLAGSFLARAVADNEELDWLNWVSPLGWNTLVAPYVADDVGVLLGLAGLCVVVAGGLLLAEHRREYGQALFRLPHRQGTGTRNIRGAFHLSFLRHRATILTWALVIAVLSAFFIALTGSLSEWMDAEDDIGRVFDDIFAGGATKTEFIAYVAKLCGILVTVAAVQAIVAYRNDELDGLVDIMRATGLRRWVPFAVSVTMVHLTLIAGVVGLLLGGSGGLWTQDNATSEDYRNLIPAVLSQISPSLLLAGIAIALVGLAPRLTHVGWAPVAVAAMLTIFGPILQVPQWLIDLSPFEYVNTATDPEWGIHVFLGCLGLLFTLAGMWGARQREIR